MQTRAALRRGAQRDGRESTHGRCCAALFLFVLDEVKYSIRKVKSGSPTPKFSQHRTRGNCFEGVPHRPSQPSCHRSVRGHARGCRLLAFRQERVRKAQLFRLLSCAKTRATRKFTTLTVSCGHGSGASGAFTPSCSHTPSVPRMCLSSPVRLSPVPHGPSHPSPGSVDPPRSGPCEHPGPCPPGRCGCFCV